jgi:hypothetical protein
MSNGNGHRWSKFWWCDWQNDQQLKLCTLAAQGLWMRLLCMMYDENGRLLVNGVRPTEREIATITSVSERQIKRYLAELLQRGVARVDDGGVIYCKRMVSDIAAGEAGKQWGKAGGNPKLNPPEGLTPLVNPKRGNGVNPLPYPPPLNQKLEAEEEEEKEPPVGPRQAGTGARGDGSNPRALGTNPRALGTNPRAKPHRNGFVELERRLQAAENAATIDGTSKEIVDFLEFTRSRPKLVGGANG